MSRHSRNMSKRRKPWQVEAAIKDLHSQMKTLVGQWQDAYFKRVVPDNVYDLLIKRDVRGLQWVSENGYHWDHNSVREVSADTFSMEFKMYKGDKSALSVVNTFDFLVTHDGTVDIHALAAMIFVGTLPR